MAITDTAYSRLGRVTAISGRGVRTKEAYLAVTFSQRPAYRRVLPPAAAAGQKASKHPQPVMVVDPGRGGKSIGIEITAPGPYCANDA